MADYSKPHNCPSRRFASKHTICIATAFFAVLAIVGCSDDGLQRVAVGGTVTVDGEHLPKGAIVFVPTNGTVGPKAGGEIIDGRFEIAEANGPVVGDLRVEIVEKLEMDFELDDPDAFNEKAVDGQLPQSRIPPQYNANSNLVKTTTVEGPNEFVFDLKTK